MNSTAARRAWIFMLVALALRARGSHALTNIVPEPWLLVAAMTRGLELSR